MSSYDYDNLCKQVYSTLPEVYQMFLSNISYDKSFISLNKRLLMLACTNATSDIKRSADYHSKTGPSDWKVAAFFGKWISHHKPIQSDGNYPLNLPNSKIIEVNSFFAAFVVQSLLTTEMYPKLFDDIKYCFEFRDISGDSLTLLIQHALEFAPQATTKSSKN